MSNDYIYKVIESLNGDYLSLKCSKEYKYGTVVFELLKYIGHLHFFELLRKALIKPIISRISFPASQSPNVVIHALPLGKVVVYSCVAGPYDIPKEPFWPELGVDYVLYTDQKKIVENTVWEYRDIPDKVLKISTNGKYRNEYMRTHPYEFFSEYDYSIYVDGSMQIMSDISAWSSLISANIGIAMHSHSTCKCVYNEGKRNLLWRRGQSKGIRAQLSYYRAKKFPENNGLLEATVIVTDLRNHVAKKIYDLWWNDFCKWDSQRNQLSIPYVFWELGIPIEEAATLGGNVWLNPKMRFYPHKMEKYDKS